MRVIRWAIGLLVAAWFASQMYINIVTDGHDKACEARFWMVGVQPMLPSCSPDLMALNTISWIALAVAATFATVLFLTRRRANG
jgi:hypothetical protein